MSNFAKSVGYILEGAMIFWCPGLILHAVRGARFGGFDMLALAIALPLFCLWWLLRIPRSRRLGPALLSVLGIWLLGPLMMAINATTAGAGLALPGGWRLITIGFFEFPLYTFMLSTYDGTLGPLLITTALLPIFVVASGFRQNGRLAGQSTHA